MSATVTRERSFGLPRDRGRRLDTPDARRFAPRGRPTLADRIGSTWERLVEQGTSDCPVCGNELEAAKPCGDCGSSLS